MLNRFVSQISPNLYMDFVISLCLILQISVETFDVTPLKFSGESKHSQMSWSKMCSFTKWNGINLKGMRNFFVGNAWNDDRIRDSFEISCVSLPQLKYNG
jgi:hypothetical protein